MPQPTMSMGLEEPLCAGAVWNFVVSPILALLTWNFTSVAERLGVGGVVFTLAWLVLQLIIGRRVAAGRACPSRLLCRKLEEHVIIVTGTGSGSAALQLAKQGATVILANRSEKRSVECAERMRAEAASPLKLVTSYVLELESLVSASDFAERIVRDFERIDALVLNAGMADFAGRYVTRFHDEETNNYEFCTAVNAVSNVVLTMKMLPLLKKCDARVIIVASIAHGCADIFPAVMREAQVDLPAQTPTAVLQFFCGAHGGNFEQWKGVDTTTQTFSYGFAKFIMIAFADYLVEEHNVRAVSLQPGSISGGFQRNMPWLVQKLFGTLGYCVSQRTPREGAQTSLWATLEDWRTLEALSAKQGTQSARGALYANNIQVGKRSKLALQVQPGIDAVNWLINENLEAHIEL